MKQLLDIFRTVKAENSSRIDRTGVGTMASFGHEARFDLKKGYPLTTVRQIFTRGMIEETLWILSGSTDNSVLFDKNVHIWDSWALPEDIYTDVKRTPPELVAALAEKLGKDIQETIQLLMNADKEYAEFLIANPDHIDSPDSNTGGYAILVSNGISPTKKVKVASKGSLGPVYGAQWRAWKCTDGRVVDQIADLIENLKLRPYSRRHVVSAWNPEDLPDETKTPHQNVVDGRQCLASCHCLFQFFVKSLTEQEFLDSLTAKGFISTVQQIVDARDSGATRPEIAEMINHLSEALSVPSKKLSCKLTQRSADLAIGVSLNVASYALLTHMIAQVCNMEVNELIWSGGDCHIYSNQHEGVDLMLGREPLPLPTLWLNPNIKNIDDFTIEDIKILDYQFHPKIDFPRAAV